MVRGPERGGSETQSKVEETGDAAEGPLDVLLALSEVEGRGLPDDGSPPKDSASSSASAVTVAVVMVMVALLCLV